MNLFSSQQFGGPSPAMMGGGGGVEPFEEVLDTPGEGNWTSPVTGNVLVTGWGAGADGSAQGKGTPGVGGGGGAWGQSVYAVVADAVYSYTIGDPLDQIDTRFDGSEFLIAGAQPGSSAGGNSGDCIADTAFSGGNGGSSGSLGGGGGGAAASSAGNGTEGANPDDVVPAAGGAGVSGAGSGGNGGLYDGFVLPPVAYPATNGTAPGGGGGGEDNTGLGFGTGAPGKLIITYPVP